MNCICCGSSGLNKSPATIAPFVARRVFGRELRTCHSMQCQYCGTLFSDVRYSNDQLRKLYTGYRGAEYTTQRQRYEPDYANPPAHDYNDEIDKFLRPHIPYQPTILDWGGDDGSNTPFQEYPHDIYDINTHPVKPDWKYDLVVCSNLLEHVPYPAQTLEEIKPFVGKTLYLEIPMGPMSDTDYITKAEWHEHINFFTEQSLFILLCRANLCMTDWIRHPVNAKYYTYLLMLTCEVNCGR